MIVYWMASVLLLGAYLFSVGELVLYICWKNIWWRTSWSFLISSRANMIIHIKYFLLLCSKLLIWSCTTTISSWIHNSKSHTSRDENVSTLCIVWRRHCRFYHIIVIIWCINSWVDALRMLVAIVCHVSTVVAGSNSTFLVVAIKLLYIETSTAVVITKLSSTRSWFKSLILCSSSSLCMQMFSKVILWWFDRADDVLAITSAVVTDLSMCHVEVINVVLLMILLSVLLVFKDFSEDTFAVAINLIVTIEWHSSAMNSIELSFCTSWRSLASGCSISLCHRWSCHFNFCCWTRNEILCLVATRLDHQSFVLVVVISINGLPSSLWLSIISCISNSLIHTIHHVSLMRSFSSWRCFSSLID